MFASIYTIADNFCQGEKYFFPLSTCQRTIYDDIVYANSVLSESLEFRVQKLDLKNKELISLISNFKFQILNAECVVSAIAYAVKRTRPTHIFSTSVAVMVRATPWRRTSTERTRICLSSFSTSMPSTPASGPFEILTR